MPRTQLLWTVAVCAVGESGADIAPLSALTSLTELDLYDNQITDIAPPLSALTSLTELRLGENQITDIAPLSAIILFHNFVTEVQ
eukprot:SAG22_NODE_266_length_13340_cov_257.988445_8_plen_85_part_00